MNVGGEIRGDLSSRYRLAENVMLVAGKKEWAIYKLDEHKIIRVSPDEGQRIKEGNLSAAAIRQLMDEGVYDDVTPGPASLSRAAPVDGDSHVMPFRSAWLELTGACNLSCSHCYMDAGVSRRESRVDWCAVIEYLAAYNCQQSIFIGGEPLCHPHFIEYVELAKRIAPAMRLCVVTNGTMWNEGILERMKQLDVFLKFSLLGSAPESHDGITGVTGSFNATVRNIDLAIRLGVRLEISTTLVQSGRETPEGMRRFVTERFGCVKHSTTHVRPQGRQVLCGNFSDVCSEEMLAVHISKRFYDLARRQHPCLHGKAAFSYSGAVYPCIMSRYEKMSVETVLRQKPEEVFRRWWGLTKDKIDGCRDCALRYACFDCRGYANSMAEPPANCRLASELIASKVG